MKTLLLSVTSLLLSLAILLVGHGLQLTLIPLHAANIGWSNDWIGYTASAYFLGFVVGCITVPRLVSAVGHIRVFAGLSACAAASLLMLGIFEIIEVWLMGRFITGWCLAGLYMVIESWLNERVTTAQRGTVLSIYMVITALSIGAGQLLIGIPVATPALLFMIGAVFLILGLLPVCLGQSVSPKPIASVSFHPRKLFQVSSISVVGACLTGITTGGFWALGPLFAQNQGLSLEQIGVFMAAGIFGGACFQMPVGRLSDRIDRRKVIAGMGVLGLIISILFSTVATDYPSLLVLLIFIFGGATFPLYALYLAHANDTAQLSRIEISSSVILMHSAGSIAGPLLVSPLMNFSPYALFMVASAANALLIVWTLRGILTHREERDHVEPFIDLPKTTHEAIELAPDLPVQAMQSESPGTAEDSGLDGDHESTGNR